MSGSDDNNGGGEKMRKGSSEVPHSPRSTEDGDEMKKTKINRPIHILDSMIALEELFPLRKGLSSYYDGKSESFGNLVELNIKDSKEVGKKEHPINKKSRLIIAQERGDSFNISTHASSIPVSLPDHRTCEDKEKEDDDDDLNNGNIKYQDEDGESTP